MSHDTQLFETRRRFVLGILMGLRPDQLRSYVTGRSERRARS